MTDTRGGPGSSLGFSALRNGIHSAPQSHAIAPCFDSDPVSTLAKSAFERRFDMSLNCIMNAHRLDRYLVADSSHALQVANSAIGGGFLIVPIHVSFKSKPAASHLNFNPIARDQCVPGKRINGCSRDVLVVDQARPWELDIEIGHDRVDTQYPGGSLLRRHFFRITGDMSGESDDSVLDGNANRGGVNTRFAGEFLLDVRS